ncbi:hypothetical protein C3Y87_08520 [Carbonactinospora thermoautotrophica]|uniref:SpoIIE family protein phosphatase n=1 Tax=Carbonactinospora thermoautotrophica TaxID=1469144 RepID=UPI00226EB01B|nr:SpoIIE family protein phosphatase [Carbonactinospora thermoautotrophica]MCX9191455.1 hypothetical protein [Carbonactinospora thermoautotrophica]
MNIHERRRPMDIHGPVQGRSSEKPQVASALLEALFTSLDAGVCATDAEGRVTACNPEAERLLGYSAAELLGRPIHELVHHRRSDGRPLPYEECRLLAVTRTGCPDRGENEMFVRRDGTLFPVSWSSAPIVVDGVVTGLVVVFEHASTSPAVQPARPAELTVLAEANARLGLLEEASAVLVSALEPREALRRLARIVVPRLADWSVVELLVEPDRLERVAVGHHNPDRLAEYGFQWQLSRTNLTAAHPLARVLHGEGPILLERIEPHAQTPIDAAYPEFFARFGATSAIVAPLTARHHVLGAITLVRNDPDRPYGKEDLRLVADLTERAALAVDNTRLFAAQRQLGEAMQRSLLPRLPKAEGLELAARYVPAGEAAQVGGDWYDAFPLPEGDTALVIGDVAGHGVRSAALMAKVRNMLRALVIDRGEAPPVVLGRLDRALRHLDVADMATGILGYVESSRSGRSWLRWANAGHPPPLLLTPGRRARFLDRPADLVLGFGHLSREEGRIMLPSGSTLLLYTDGLVERRSLTLDVGLARLRRIALALADHPLEDFCDAVLERMGTGASDDITLLAARVP